MGHTVTNELIEQIQIACGMFGIPGYETILTSFPLPIITLNILQK